MVLIMNVYDFDKTIFNPDSSKKFIFYCLKKKPYVVYRLPLAGVYFIKYKLGLCEKDAMKEKLFSIIRHFQPLDKYVHDFWSKNMDGFSKYYLAQKRPDDVIISASPSFLLRDICKELGIGTLIASEADEKTGKWLRKNCYGAEKVVRYREIFGDAKIDEFYSDSLSDSPLAEIAEKAFIVDYETLTPWEEYKKQH